MKRPLVTAALCMLAGALCGIAIVPAMTKAAVLILAIVFLLRMITESRDLGKGTLLFLCTILVLIFAIGFLRGRRSSRIYESPELSAFYEKYEATNPGEFDYALYLKGMGVTSEEERETMGEPPVPWLKEARERLGQILDENLTEHDAGILHAMLLGDKTQMDPVIKELYQTSGISHLLAVSGLHISLIGMGCFSFLRKKLHLSMTLSILAASVCTFLYVCLTGASASAVRAGLMLFVNLLSRKKGRTYDLMSALSLAFLLLLFKEPYVIFLSGFQLSFGAMAGIFLGNEVTLSLSSAGMLKRCPALLSSLISSVSVTLVTLPVTLSNYYFFPPYGVLLNLVVIPLMTAVMSSGICVLIFGLLRVPVLLPIAAGPCHAVLLFYEWLTEKVSSLPFAKIVTGKPGETGILLYGAVLCLGYLILTGELSVRRAQGREERNMRRKRDLCRILVSSVMALSVILLRYREPDRSYVQVLDVGQGDCFHVHDGGVDVLIDGGSSGYDKVGENVIEPYLLSKGIGRLDAVIVSHADSDHTNGIRYLLTEGKAEISSLLLPAMAVTDEKYESLKAGRYGSLSYLKAGDSLRTGSMTLGCLYCGEGAAAASDTNRQSDVMLLEKGNFTMLFTGDMTKEDELLLIGSPYGDRIENVDVLKVAHHGSRTASGKEFLKRTDPSLAVLSYRKNNSFGHPHRETVDALEETGAKLLRTPEAGAAKIIIKEDGYDVECFRKDRQIMKTK